MKSLVFLLSVLLFACSKDDAPAQKSATVIALQANTWVNDSIAVVDDADSAVYTIRNTEPKPEVYFDDKWMHVINSGPSRDSFLYEVREPNRLYRWRPQNGKDTSEYFIIETLAFSELIWSFKDPTSTEYDYFSGR